MNLEVLGNFSGCSAALFLPGCDRHSCGIVSTERKRILTVPDTATTEESLFNSNQSGLPRLQTGAGLFLTRQASEHWGRASIVLRLPLKMPVGFPGLVILPLGLPPNQALL